MFEIKLEGGSATMEMPRTPHPLAAADTRTSAARRRLEEVLAEQRIAPVGELGRATGTAYRRITLTDHVRPLRITVDTDLVVRSAASVGRALDDRLLLEVKAPTDRDPVHHLLHELGVRPISVSKYAAGLALLHPELPRAPWAPTLRRHFPVASADAAVLATVSAVVTGVTGVIGSHSAAIANFPTLTKHDPFDRMLLAQAQVEGMRLLTSDRVLLAAAPDLTIDARA